MSPSYDVIVVGLGAMGSATAATLAALGQRVLGLDGLRPPHNRGSSHGKTRAIRQAYFEDPAYVPLLRRAYDLWHKLERDTGQHLLETTGLLMLGNRESQVVAGSLRSAQEHRLPHEVLEAVELRRRYPAFAVTAGTLGLFEEIAGVLRPEDCIAAYLGEALRQGAELRLEEPVTAWESNGEGVKVTTAMGTYTAGRLVLTPGPWAPDLLRYRVPLAVMRKVIVWFAPEGEAEAFQPNRFPIWIWETEDGTIPYGFPGLPAWDKNGVKAGLHSGGSPCTAATVDRDVHEADIQALRHSLEGRIPALATAPVRRSCVCLYTHTPDDHFLLGPHPEQDNVLLAAGFSGHGFKFAGVVGEVLADWVVEGKTAHPVEIFDPGRFAGASASDQD
jgi:sarcosine oxidase